MWKCTSLGDRQKLKGTTSKMAERQQRRGEQREEEEVDEDKEEKKMVVFCNDEYGSRHFDGHSFRYPVSYAKDFATFLCSSFIATIRKLPSMLLPPHCRYIVGLRQYQREEKSSLSLYVLEEEKPCICDMLPLHCAALGAHSQLSIKELCEATLDFCEDNILGKGSSSTVYGGKLCNGLAVAVKVFNPRLKDAQRCFMTEIEMMCHVRHEHIQPLIGYCIEHGKLALVYKYMPQGSLECALHGKDRPVLSWRVRCKVALGVVKALYYLHMVCKPSIIHRDVKTSNILLSRRLNPKISDFGLAIRGSPAISVSHEITGTFGYLAPEYLQVGQISTKIDIYSLGVLLLELMTGRRPLEQKSFSSWGRQLVWNNSRIIEAVADAKLKGFYSFSGMRRMLGIAALCVHPIDIYRPSINLVLSLMQKEPTVNIDQLVMKAYSNLQPFVMCHNHFGSCEDDERQKHFEMAMVDVHD